MTRGNIDVSGLKTYAFGSHSMVWWGTLGYIVIESTFLAVLIGTYLYGAKQALMWPPPASAPSVWYGTATTLLLLVSVVPVLLYQRAAKSFNLRGVRIWLPIAALMGIGFVGLRIAEFMALTVRWDSNFYGSILWTLLGMHGLLVFTDVVDSIVLSVLAFTHPVGGKRFGDVCDNAFYWKFVVISWLPIYALIYLVPYFTGGGGG